MNVEIGAEAALFPEKEYINGIAVAVHSISSPALLSCLVLFLFCSLSCSIPLCILACSMPVLYLACFNPSVSCPVFGPVPSCPVFSMYYKKSYILPCIMPALSVCDKSIYILLPMKTQYTYTLSNDLATKGIYLYFFAQLYCIVRDFFCVKGVKTIIFWGKKKQYNRVI